MGLGDELNVYARECATKAANAVDITQKDVTARQWRSQRMYIDIGYNMVPDIRKHELLKSAVGGPNASISTTDEKTQHHSSGQAKKCTLTWEITWV